MSAIHLSFVIIDYHRVYQNLRSAQLDTTHANAKLTTSNNALASTNARLVETQQRLEQALVNAEDLAAERERARVASEIHDGLGGHLSTLKVHLELAAGTVEEDPARAAAAFAVAEEEAAAAQRELRRAVEALNAGTIAQPLDVLLAALARATEHTGLRTTLAIHGEMQPLAQPVQHALYRIAQEAQHNAQRHASATLVEIALDFRVDGEVQLWISDNGIGLPDRGAAQPQGHGLRNMHNRVLPLGGTLVITSQPNQGVSLWVTLPLTGR